MIIYFAWKLKIKKEAQNGNKKGEDCEIDCILNKALKLNPEYLKLKILNMSRSGNV